LGATGWFFAGAGGAVANPIENELKYLIEQHPKIHEAEKTLESRGVSIKEATALYFPTVTATGQIGPEVVDSPTTRSNNAEGDPWRGVKNVAGLTVRQNLFDGFSTESLVQAARINRDISAISLEGTRQNTLFEGVRAYVDVLRQRRLVELSRENERTIQQQLNLEDERVRRGITDTMLGLSVGLEDAADLIADLEQALA
jgi:adhesin transport system outer membrane protein